jgi:hypothetical protein
MKKPVPITLAQLRAAAPKGIRIKEYLPRYFAPSGRCWYLAVDDVTGGERLWSVTVSHRDRQSARRAALTALEEIAKGEGR